MPEKIDPRRLDDAIETASTATVHLADRHIEEAQALMTMIRTLAANSEPDEWANLQAGILINSRQVEQRLADARKALDEV